MSSSSELKRQFQYPEIKKLRTLFLFDVDGTLTLPRQHAGTEMLDFLTFLKRRAVVGIIGGSDLGKITEQITGNNNTIVRDFPYVFAENGLIAYKNGVSISKESIKTFLGEEKLKNFINFVLHYIAELDIPIKRGTFVEFRTGMINISPVGRSVTQDERIAFNEYDKVHNIRQKMVDVLKEKFSDYNLHFAIGGQISIDVFPKGWDKSFCLRHLENDRAFDEIHFFGDKTSVGGNDHELYISSKVTGHSVKSPEDTINQVSEILKKNKIDISAESKVLNPYLDYIKPDIYYHLGLDSGMIEKKEIKFDDVKFVLMGGAAPRMKILAADVHKALNIPINTDDGLPKPIGKTDRFSLFKVGPVICVNHGMGEPSLNILLHELVKLLNASKATNYCFIRVGTCGGLGIEPGTVVLTTHAYNGMLDENYTWYALGKTISRPCETDEALLTKLYDCRAISNLTVIKGKTLSALDFYESQGRCDGAICEYTEKEKFDWIEYIYNFGIRNIEMEADCLCAFCTKVKVPCAVACVAIVNRLRNDQVESTVEQLKVYENKLLNYVVTFVKNEISSI